MNASTTVAPSDGHAIVVEGLTRVFRRQTAVDHVSFRAEAGQVTAVVFYFAGLTKANDASLSTTAHRSCHVEGSRDAVRAGDRPVRQNAFDGFEPMNLGCQTVHHLDVDRHLRFWALGRCGQRRADFEQFPLDVARKAHHLDVVADRPCKAEGRVQLVDRAIGFNAERALRDAPRARRCGVGGPSAAPGRPSASARAGCACRPRPTARARSARPSPSGRGSGRRPTADSSQRWQPRQ